MSSKIQAPNKKDRSESQPKDQRNGVSGFAFGGAVYVTEDGSLSDQVNSEEGAQ